MAVRIDQKHVKLWRDTHGEPPVVTSSSTNACDGEGFHRSNHSSRLPVVPIKHSSTHMGLDLQLFIYYNNLLRNPATHKMSSLAPCIAKQIHEILSLEHIPASLNEICLFVFHFLLSYHSLVYFTEWSLLQISVISIAVYPLALFVLDKFSLLLGCSKEKK